jgi:hypothetical protein
LFFYAVLKLRNYVRGRLMITSVGRLGFRNVDPPTVIGILDSAFTF